jgi:hypothetical protein
MNYKHIYNQLCQRSQPRTWEKFKYEKHHIIPKSMGGDNSKSNIAILTPREHAFAHLLLVRFLSGTNKAKMIFALKSMISYKNEHRAQLTTRQYETLRRAYQTLSKTSEYSAWRSELTKSQWTSERRAAVAEKTRQQWATGTKRQSFGSDEYRQKKSQQMKKRWKDTEYQNFISETVKAQWQDPTKRPNR